MPISFDNIPNTIRVPWTYIEFNNTGAVTGSALQSYKTLIIGQKITGGTAENGKLVKVTSADEAAVLFGKGSLLHLMAKKYFKSNSYTETWFAPLADAEAGVAATKTLTVTGSPTADGTIYLMVGGQEIAIAVTSGMPAADIATAIVTAVSAAGSCPTGASAAGAVVTLTAKWKGITGNDIDVRYNFYTGESLPAGVTLAVAPGTAGAVNPDVSAVIDLIASEQFNVIVCPYTDTANLTALKDEMSTRWGPMVQKEGVIITAKVDTLANLTTFGSSQNSQFLCCPGIKGSPSPAFEIAASVGAIVAYYGPIDPARPFQTLELKGILAPATEDRFSATERNSLLWDGIATLNVDSSGVVRVERLVTTYQKNDAGAADTSYLDLNTILTLSYLRYDFRTMMLTKYPRHKLGDDGKLYGVGQAIMTPSLGKAEAIARYRLWEEKGLVENADDFAAALVVERNSSDVNRLDFLLAPDLMNQFMVAGVQIKFIL